MNNNLFTLGLSNTSIKSTIKYTPTVTTDQ